MNAFGCFPNGLLANPVQISQEGAILSLIFERIQELGPGHQAPLIEVLDRYCIACEMESAMTKTARK